LRGSTAEKIVEVTGGDPIDRRGVSGGDESAGDGAPLTKSGQPLLEREGSRESCACFFCADRPQHAADLSTTGDGKQAHQVPQNPHRPARTVRSSGGTGRAPARPVGPGSSSSSVGASRDLRMPGGSRDLRTRAARRGTAQSFHGATVAEDRPAHGGLDCARAKTEPIEAPATARTKRRWLSSRENAACQETRGIGGAFAGPDGSAAASPRNYPGRKCGSGAPSML
jgi:hypothetical protein